MEGGDGMVNDGIIRLELCLIGKGAFEFGSDLLNQGPGFAVHCFET